MRARPARRLAAVIALSLIAALGWPAGTASANTVGNILYQVGPNEDVTYARVIRLAHSGAANGRLLATFEYGVPTGSAAKVQVRQSLDDGQTWSTLAQVPDGMTGPGHPGASIYQPFLFELPQQVGAYPAGTLLLTANVIGSDNSTNFQLWRSTDHGATWTYVSMYQYARNADVPPNDDPGIWEPFLTLNGQGKLVAFFADERQRASHSQFVGHIVSNDGGDTWSANPDGSTNYAPGLVKDVATSVQAERPGMPTVTRLPNGTFVLGYEICARAPMHDCEAYIKKSTDGGNTWGTGPADPGTFVVTTDGRFLGSSPYVVWSPGGGPNGRLLMAGMHVRLTTTNEPFALEDHEAVFVNTNNGDGPWSWFPAPLQIQHGGLSNYSPSLLPSTDGTQVRYTAPSYVSGLPKSERTESANAGVLPYAAPWTAGSQKGWKHYGGSWNLAGGILSETAGGTGGSKSLAGSTGWTNYVLEADVRRDTAGPAGNAGVLVRVSNPALGTDALTGYYVGVGASGVQLGKMNHNWTPIFTRPIDGGSPVGTWIHLRVEVTGCTITVIAKRADDPNPPPPTKGYIDLTCPSAGAVGVRTFDGTASWRNLTVTPS